MKQPATRHKWLIYLILTTVISLGTITFDAGTMLASYPTEKHRDVARELNEMTKQAFSGGKDSSNVMESDAYKALEDSRENVYSTRMGIGSSLLSLIISTAIIVAVYRYFRRSRLTNRPIGATVGISAVTAVLTGAATLLYGAWLTPFNDSGSALLALLAMVPLVAGFGALYAFLVAKATEWHYNRSHGFMED